MARVPDEGATPSEPVSDKQKLSGQEDPDEPTRFASATSPQPTSRPAGVVMPHELPSLVTLPALTSNAKGAPRPAVTEPGVPIDRTMLVGILGFENGRKALLRLPNGDYRYVIVGDVLDGWRISMIGVDAMRITRNGEERTLLLINR